MEFNHYRHKNIVLNTQMTYKVLSNLLFFLDSVIEQFIF